MGSISSWELPGCLELFLNCELEIQLPYPRYASDVLFD